MKTITQIRKYEAEIDVIEAKIKCLQDRCKHKNVVKQPKGNTGNWDKNDDAYWYEIDCNDCDKHWTEPQ